MHERIKGFFREGELADGNLVASKDRLITDLESSMRDWGYVPCLDLEPQFTLKYLPGKEVYEFKITVYGANVGRENSWSVSAVSNGKKIMKSTLPSKLSQS